MKKNKKVKSCKIKPTILTTHNHQRTDDYFWMNERDSDEVLEYINKENKHTKKFFKPLKNSIQNLLNEFDNRINPNDISAPFYLNQKKYQYKNQEGKDYALIFQLFEHEEILFFDENERAENQPFYELADWSPSPDNSILAIGEDFVGRRKYEISFRDNKNMSFLYEKLTDTNGVIIWGNDNKTVFYTKKDEQTLRENQVFRHVLGTSQEDDVLVYEDTDERFNVSITKSITNKFIEIHSNSSTTSEILLIAADSPDACPKVFLNRKKGHIYQIQHHTTGFFILTNDKAENNKILFSNKIPSSLKECKEIQKHDKEIFIEGFLSLNKFLIIEERTNGLQKIKILTIKNNKSNYIEFSESTYSIGLSINDNFNSDKLYFTYNSLTTPATVFEYNLTKGNKSIFFKKELLDSTFNPEDYQSERIWITANDGTQIPVCLVYKKGIQLFESPLLLYGYGSYGITYPDTFSPYRLSLLNRGFVFAIAHIRGEKYLGEEWYQNGKFLKKKNTFTDFINAAEQLGLKGYCDPHRIYAKGGSAGGLLMGTVTNMAPYLWKGIIAQVPFVDVVTTMLDESIPLTVGEYEEWGNPNEEQYYWYMLSYSPYDNVKKMDYPNMYITTGYHDSQVQYWEPLKWVAKLRKFKTNDNYLLFDCNMDAGHGGGSGRTSERLEIAKEYLFLLHLEGVEV